jgi:hypothetical protein
MKNFLLPFVIISISIVLFVSGCSDDTAAPPAVFAVSSATATVAPTGVVVITISGGTTPYALTSAGDAAVATSVLAGTSLSITGVLGGYTTVIIQDGSGASITIPVVVTGPITSDLFPLVLGHKFTFKGYAIATTGLPLADPMQRYQTIWTIGPAGPFPGSTVIVDSTRFIHPTLGEIGVARNLIIVKNPVTGEYLFAQTLGPFFRAFNIPRVDTVRLVSIAKPEVGIGGTWTSFDSSYVDGTGATIRLEILGEVEDGEVITDSSGAGTTYETIRFRTWRRISVNSAVVVDNATTSKIWLRKGVGPIQVLIAQDTENFGHFRTLSDKNF